MKGRQRDIFPIGNKTVITLEIDTKAEALDGLSGKELEIKIGPFKETRGPRANAYFHVLCTKIAEKIGTSMIEVKNRMIADYGQVAYDETGALDWSVKPATFNWTKSVDTHYQPTDRLVNDKGNLYPLYIVMRPTHTYNTAEMARIIDGTVEEAKGLGIETMTPEQLHRMISAWTPEKEKH